MAEDQDSKAISLAIELEAWRGRIGMVRLLRPDRDRQAVTGDDRKGRGWQLQAGSVWTGRDWNGRD